MSSASASRIKGAGAALGALAGVLALGLQRPANVCSDTGPDDVGGPMCTIMYVHPLPIWAWLAVGIVGALVGWLMTDLGLKTVQRST